MPGRHKNRKQQHTKSASLLDASTVTSGVTGSHPFDPTALDTLASLDYTASIIGQSSDSMANRNALNSSSLEDLQSDDARQLMDTVDRLRKAGLGSVIQLPQIVTVGDQSSGKSSTLEAITGIPFPRKENLCTRFATQIVLRRANTESVSVSVIPDKLRSSSEQDRLKQMQFQLDDFGKLGELMDDVTEAMGLNAEGAITRAFSRDVLNIEISGPSRAHLTLVDLPGLIHSENKQQTREDVELISHLVEEYIQEKRTIVLAVVSAKNDYANQIVLKKARDLQAADRTLGIVTKVDFLEPGSENERSWLDLAQNKDVFFGLGWHMLRNRAPKEMATTLEDRDRVERIHFSEGVFRQLDRDTLGVDAFRKRLSTLLHQHLTSELPGLQEELDSKYKETCDMLGKLGQARSSGKEQRHFLMDLGQRFEKLVDAGVAGNYDGEFYVSIDTSQPVTHESNNQRLRALVQTANLDFAQVLRKFGAKYKVTDHPSELSVLEDGEDDDEAVGDLEVAAKKQQILQSYDEAVQWVQAILERSRGRELPGNFNPMLISQLFKEQSQPWTGLASAHVEFVAHHCAKFVERSLMSVTTEDVYKRVMANLILPGLQRRKDAAYAELGRILADEALHPITYNHYYTDTIQKLRAKKQQNKMKAFIEQHRGEPLAEAAQGTLNIGSLVNSLVAINPENNMEKFSAEDALLCQMAYYKDESKYFINCVTKQVIERCLIHNLANDIISAISFGDMDDKQVSNLAREPKDIMQERERLRRKKEMLEEGKEAFRKEMGGF